MKLVGDKSKQKKQKYLFNKGFDEWHTPTYL